MKKLKEYLDWDSWGDLYVGLIIVIVLFLCCFLSYYPLSYGECRAATQDIGFEHRWSFMGGCQIEVTPGQWIPIESYRFVQDQ